MTWLLSLTWTVELTTGLRSSWVWISVWSGSTTDPSRCTPGSWLRTKRGPVSDRRLSISTLRQIQSPGVSFRSSDCFSYLSVRWSSPACASSCLMTWWSSCLKLPTVSSCCRLTTNTTTKIQSFFLLLLLFFRSFSSPTRHPFHNLWAISTIYASKHSAPSAHSSYDFWYLNNSYILRYLALSAMFFSLKTTIKTFKMFINLYWAFYLFFCFYFFKTFMAISASLRLYLADFIFFLLNF